MQDHAQLLATGRDAYGRRDWPTARESLGPLRDDGALTDPDDLFALADSAWWLGLVDESNAVFEEAYRAYLAVDRPQEAAMAAMSIAISCYLRGEESDASGWMGRCTRLLADDDDTVMHGYARYVLEVESQFGARDPEGVLTAAREVQAIGRRHGDPNLTAAGMLGEGRVLVRHREVARGMALMDEAMVSVLADELSPDWAGNIYCNVMIACHELAEHGRAAHWTDATERWLDTLPVAVLFRGICRVHRSQVHQLRGAWDRAEREALRVVDDLADISVLNVAEAWYQVAEVRRLRGDLDDSEEAYRNAHRHGRDPQPGLALLRLAQGRAATALASLETALAAHSGDRLSRAPLLSAQVDALLAVGDASGAASAGEELTTIAETYGSSGLLASARQAAGCIELASGDAAAAVRLLREALTRWQALDAPYDVACVRRRLARAYDLLGDQDAAELEREAAATAFDELGAPVSEPFAANGGQVDGSGGTLTARELEVLRLVAAGRTNRQVASELFISEKTVARHLSNIFTKLDLSSRTEAAAFAFERGLASPRRG
jgi:DNA-binding NarL/FixJ family response regulator